MASDKAVRYSCELTNISRRSPFYIQSIGFALLIIGVNYLIFKERLLGEVATTAEKYVNQAVFLFWTYDI